MACYQPKLKATILTVTTSQITQNMFKKSAGEMRFVHEGSLACKMPRIWKKEVQSRIQFPIKKSCVWIA